MRLIDADKLIEAMAGACNIYDAHGIDATVARSLITIADKAPTVGRWISVDDRVPEDGLVGMLVYDGENPPTVCTTCITIRDGNGKKLYSNNPELVELMLKTVDTKLEYITHITHWMPMPEPPYPMMEV